MKKHVTIDASIPGTPTEKIHSGRTTPNDGSNLCKTTDVPRHLLPPGHDGYRTPTIEDYEQHNSSALYFQQNRGLSRDGSQHQLPHTPPAFLDRHSANPSSSSLAQSILDRLHWRERIRHYTWTFFTMTMAVSWFSIKSPPSAGLT